jgi:hypothetical protein
MSFVTWGINERYMWYDFYMYVYCFQDQRAVLWEDLCKLQVHG